MRDTIILLGICVAAIVIGVVLYFNNIGANRQIPDLNPEVQTSTVSTNPVMTGPVTFLVLGQGVRASGVSERKNFAVRDEASFAELWDRIHGEDGEVAPPVDFKQYQVVGVFAGVKPSGGYAISVLSVVDTETERTVTIALTVPGEGCVTTQALTNPYQLIRLPASDLPLEREYVEEIRSCN